MQNIRTGHLRIVMLLLVMTLISCSRDPIPDPPSPEPSLTVHEIPAPFRSADSESVLRFSTSEAWHIETSAADDDSGEWFAVAPTHGDAGNDITVTVSVDANPSYESRSFTLTIHTASLEQTLDLTQLKRNAIIAGENLYEVSDEAQTLTVAIQSNVDYEVEIAAGAEWLSVDDTRAEPGLTTTEHRFTVAANSEPTTRTATIVFRDATSDLQDEVTVMQAAWVDPDPERAALMAIWREAGGTGWTHADNWCGEQPLGEWYGVTTDAEGHVVELRLPHNNLCGGLAHEIANLTQLRILDLSHNGLDCELIYELPEDCAELVRSDLDDLYELEEIDLSHNRLRSAWGGVVALQNMPRLRRVDLSYNELVCWVSSKFWTPLFENGRTVDLIFNGNRMYGDVDDFIQNHPDWDRLALQLVRQYYPEGGGMEYTKAIHIPDFTFTDLRNGSQQSIRAVCGANVRTMVLAWDPTDERSNRFAERSVRRYHTLYGPQGFAVVAILPEGEEYRQAAEQYLASHEVAWPVAADYADTQGRRIVLPAEPYPSYLLFDRDGKLVDDVHNYTTCSGAMYPEEPITFDLTEREFQYANYMNLVCDEAFGDCTYESSDYSMDKQSEVLQRATCGRGIDIVLIGEVFTDIDIETGFYRDAMEYAMEAFFSVEPTKSYREYFNVHTVYAVSKKRQLSIWGYDSALWTELIDYNTGIKGDPYTVRNYAYCAQTSSSNVFPTVIINGDDGRGRVTFFESSTEAYPYVGLPYNGRGYCRGILQHESIGHGFGLLGDQYHHIGAGEIPSSNKNRISLYHKNGSFLNLSLTDDPNAVPWAHLIGHPRFPEIGIVEGGDGYERGVWTSSGRMCIMASAGGDFSAWCRELIVKRILTLAGEEYTFEKFLEKDVLSAKTSAHTTRTEPEIRYEHHPPVFLSEK